MTTGASALPRLVVVGGCGHVGLPLALAFAGRGAATTSYDIDPRAVATVQSGRMPFDEPGASELLAQVLERGTFTTTTDPAVVADADVVIVVVGTPVDEHLNPDPQAVPLAVAQLAPHLRDGQLLVLRSTVYPGVTRLMEKQLASLGRDIDLAFCPERIAEGRALVELYELPQIVCSRSERGVERASAAFRLLTERIVVVSPEEGELAKLFTNTWRYLKFAAANQLYMIANDYGLDFERIRAAITEDYPRASDMPGAGFAAGPCLFKDTLQLAAFHNNNFTLGHASVAVNEGLPLYVVSRMEKRFDLVGATVGILGMAFKPESDDIRSSLSYKLRRLLRVRAERVLCSDPYVTADPDLVPLEVVLDEADLLVVGAPHRVYRSLSPRQPTVDVWNVFGRGVVL